MLCGHRESSCRMILAYTGWAYWVFRGKVDAEGYH